VKFHIWHFHENPPRKSKFRENRAYISGTLREDLSKFHCY